MKPLDPRLLRYASAARAYLVAAIAMGVVVTVLVLAQAALLARLLAGTGPRTFGLIALLAVVAVRALASYAGEASALRAAAAVKSQLRRRLVAHALRTAGGDGGRKAGEVVTLATKGLDALDGYFARYLPQLVLAVLTPLAVLAVVGTADLLSAVVMVLTLPLIPIFMILIGLHTQKRTERQWRLLERLGGHLLDVVEGLPTLKIFNRAKAQVQIIRSVTEAHRRATMETLRVAFLSALVLELLATLAVALVAVQIGLRLLGGGMPYETALLVLLLAPEAYLPLRAVGARFHASMEGVAAAQGVFDVLRTPLPGYGSGEQMDPNDPALNRPDLTRDPIRLDGVTVRYPNRDAPGLENVSLTIEPGRRVVVTGPSGAGKSTLLSVLLKFVEPSDGVTSFADVPADVWRRQIAWVPQRPYLFSGTIADNIRLGAPDANADDVRRAARLAGAAGFIESLPQAYDTDLAEGGLRLSAGQRQRIALARAFLRDAPLLLLDEPTAHLDGVNARAVRDAVERLMAGRTVVLVTHDRAWTRNADRVVAIDTGRLAGWEVAA